MTLSYVVLECIWNDEKEIHDMEKELGIKIVDITQFGTFHGCGEYMFIGHYEDLVNYIMNYYGTDDIEIMREEVKSIKVLDV